MVKAKSKSKSRSNKRKKPQAKSHPPAAHGPVIHMPDSTSVYLKSLCDPATHRSVGLPASDNVGALTSLKQHAFGKGTFQIGVNGWGYVMLVPGAAVANNSVAVQGSTSTYPGTTVGGGLGPEIFTGQSNSMFATADFGNAPLAQYRIVSAVLKIRYSGTQLNLGGTVRALQHPNHETLSGLNAAAIEGYRQSKRFPVSRDWDQVVYCPLTDQYNANPGASVALPYSIPFMAFLVSSTASNEFEYEYYVNYEMVGRNIRGQTICVKDPAGYAAITSAMAVEGGAFRGSPRKMEHTILENVKEFLTSASTWIGEKAAKAIPIVIEHTPAILEAAASLL